VQSTSFQIEILSDEIINISDSEITGIVAVDKNKIKE